MLSQKFNDMADDKEGVTYVRARPWMAALLRKMGFEVLERIVTNLNEYGSEGVTYFYTMKREPGAKNNENATLS